MVESGIFYGTLVDPLLTSMRQRILPKIKKGETVIDIACGTGAQVFILAGRAAQVTGVDLSQSMIDYASKKLQKNGLKNVTFFTADATRLEQFVDKSFDVATMTLALHQFEPGLYEPILSEMKRIANRVVIIDYAVPLPKNYTGVASHAIEFFAGIEHNRNFKLYCKAGGLNSILPEHGIKIQKSVFIAKGAFQLVIAASN
jgi:ubiquinone/menaquinone biosynthesis C-methylase UbiE